MDDRRYANADDAAWEKLGQGRSGEVFLVPSNDGPYTIKVFRGDTLGNLVHYLFTGAPNPYIWNEDAIRSAYERRKILESLLPCWFGADLRLAAAMDVSFNGRTRSWQLAAEYVRGTPVQLLHPLQPRDGALHRLHARIMQPLQRRLMEAGFYGTVWQAGLGNPVALNNFLREQDGRFRFIDVESGVPALFPLDPDRLFDYYLPRAWSLGRPLFDDVDTRQLRQYLQHHRRTTLARLDDRTVEQLHRHTESLAAHQQALVSLTRMQRSIAYQQSKGRLTEAQAQHYLSHPLRWHVREARRAAVKAAHLAVVRVPKKLWSMRPRIHPLDMLRGIGRFVTSQQYRTEIGHNYVLDRIDHWHQRDQVTSEQADRLRQELADAEQSSTYITDFGTHLGMKASFLALELLFLTGLLSFGVLGFIGAGVIFAIDGTIYRSLYTGYRMGHATAKRQPRPWIALGVGVVPLFGSLAYPAQMLWSAGARHDHVARFIILDTFTRLGARIPIWGGEDTLVEHAFNRLGARVARLRAAAPAEPDGAAAA